MTPLAAFGVLAGVIVVLFGGLYWLSTRLDTQDGTTGDMDDQDSGHGHSHSPGGGSDDGPSIGAA
jgi:hypothetical protein